MPIQLQCTSIVIRNDALDRVLDADAGGFASIAPNSMSYADDCLSQASFMSPLDAEEFAKSLELRGLNRDTEIPDFVVVQTADQSIQPQCDWLILFEFEQRLVATMRGNESQTLIAPAGDEQYDPNIVQHYSADEIDRLFEFVERKDNIDTYRHKETGKLVYHTRKTETPDEIFTRAFEQIWKLRREPGTPPKTTGEASTLSGPIADLQSLAAKHPEASNVLLALGMAWFATGKPDTARRHLERASDLDPTNTAILKELGGVCLDQQDFPAAAKAGVKAVAVAPDDADLLGNLAVCQLLAGEGSKALQTITHALRLDPNDSVNGNLGRLIGDVLQGRRDQPQTLRDLMNPMPQRKAEKKKSLFSKLFGFGK